MLRGVVLAGTLLCAVCIAAGQMAVPYTTAADRFGVFLSGRFLDLEPRAPVASWPMGGRPAYATADGRLMRFVDGRAQLIGRLAPSHPEAIGRQVQASRNIIAWRDGPALRIAGTGPTLTVGRDVGAFSVHDSLVVFHDRAEGTLNVFWKGRSFPVADVERTVDAPQWKAGANTLVFHDRTSGRLLLCYRGEVRVLCDSADNAVVDAGGDVVAFMDEGAGVFRVFHRGRVHDLEQLRPVSTVTGWGVVAYVSATGGFRIFQDGRPHRVSAGAPTGYFVQDSVVTWMDRGRWCTLVDGATEVIEPYVPESWQVCGETLAYPDLNREPRSYRRGERTVLSTEAGIRGLRLVDDAAVWNARDGTVRAWWRGKVYGHD